MSDCVRPWRIDDAEPVLHASRVADLVRQIKLPTDDLGGARVWVRGRLGADAARYRSCAIETAGELAGEVALHGIDATHAVATVGYWLTPEARGLGLATRSVCTLVDWAFRELGIERVELAHRVNNRESARVAERCGFSFEGVQRGRLRYDGVRYDVATYARLVGDPPPGVGLLTLT